MGDNFGFKEFESALFECDTEQRTPLLSEEPPCSGASWGAHRLRTQGNRTMQLLSPFLEKRQI